MYIRELKHKEDSNISKLKYSVSCPWFFLIKSTGKIAFCTVVSNEITVRNGIGQQSLGLPFKCGCGEKKYLLSLCSEIWLVFIIRGDWVFCVPFLYSRLFVLSQLTHTLHLVGKCCSQSTSCASVGGSHIN